MDRAGLCPLCCESCMQSGVGSDHDNSIQDPFALHSLLPAGTITVNLHGSHFPCTHKHASDGWHLVPLRQLSGCAEDDICCMISFLTEHQFLRATCCLGTNQTTLYIRIYLVPTDLPSVRGQLRHRSKPVLAEGSRYLQSLLPMISQDHSSWKADEHCQLETQEHLFPKDIDNRTMAEIYSDLPSSVSSMFSVGDEIRGLRSTPYEYQRQSIAVMMEKELSSRPIQDPLYIPVSSIDGRRFYFHPSTLNIVLECPEVTRCKGGILCEELGTGKTVMILGLILETLDQLPQPEDSILDPRPIMSPLAYRAFPTDEYIAARRRFGIYTSSVPHLPSLVEILLHRISIRGDGVDVRPYEERLEASNLWHLLQANTPFYHQYPSKAPIHALSPSRTRDRVRDYPRVMYVTAATLIVVPVNLLGQWDREILKHCHSVVRYLIVQQTTQIPTAKVLASNYDIIVMTDNRFRRESAKNKVARLHKLQPCTCPPFSGSRVPNCCCPSDPAVSSLLQIRWKRLVIDEGHTSGNIAATLNHFVRKLSIERKWIVTGTPTSNLLGLSLGRKLDDELEDVIRADNLEKSVRIWGTFDYVNLRKLGVMISDLLAVPQFNFDLKLFANEVSLPLCDRRGPHMGAIKVLTQVMEMVMVRHRIEDIENEITIPPMHHMPIYMDLDAYAAKSYNAMQAGIVINAIDSERSDLDYLFHPRNVKNLQNAMDNLSQGMFWSASDILYNVDQICHEASQFLARAIERKVSDDDMKLLKGALTHAEAAAKDSLWRAMQLHEDVPFCVTRMDVNIFEAWTRGGLKDRSHALNLIHANRLTELRALVLKKPLINVDRLVEEGRALDMNEWRRCAKNATQLHDVTDAAQMKKMVSQVKDELEVLREKDRVSQSEEEVPEADIDNFIRRKLGLHSELSESNLLHSSPLSETCVGPSLSTKLNFILAEVLKHSTEEKFLIFSNSPLTLAHIAEALFLFGIKYLRYVTEVSLPLREQCVMTFESSDTFRVFLMELKLGARGLNLISASRVIFCEPVWHPDVEAQAIKRAHRIGQTKPITVKTLVIRGTAEEAMISRRHLLKGSDKVPRMTAEVGMRHFIENPRFLDTPVKPVDSPPQIQIPLLTHIAPQVQNFTSTHASEDLSMSSASMINVTDTRNEPGNTEGARKRPRMVRFAD